MKHLRRKQTKTATNTRIYKTDFEEITIKKLDIPIFIDIYNHYINAVDNADQLRSYYFTQ